MGVWYELAARASLQALRRLFEQRNVIVLRVVPLEQLLHEVRPIEVVTDLSDRDDPEPAHNAQHLTSLAVQRHGEPLATCAARRLV